MPGTAALSTVSAKHCVRAASSTGSEKDKLRTGTTVFIKSVSKIDWKKTGPLPID